MKSVLLAAASAFVLALGAPAFAERVLRIDEAPIGELDPAKGTDYADTVLAINVYDTLVYPKQGGPGVQPLLATDWTVDGLTYTFTLRDAKFHSGNPVTAQDVVYSFDRLIALGQGLSSLFAGRVASVEAVDPKTVKFTLTGPYAPFIPALTRLSIIDSKLAMARQAEGPYGAFGDYSAAWLSENDAGSGAYTVESHNPQSETVMAAFPGYMLPVGPNAPEKVRYRYGIEAATVKALMGRGEHDIADLWLPAEVIKAMAADGGVHLAPEYGATGEYIQLNTARPPLDDVYCRRALAYAFDYGTNLKLLQVGKDLSQGVPMSGALPSGLLGYDPSRPALKQDMVKAREELAKCKYDPKSSPLDIAWIAETPARERVALLMQATFSQLGFPVTVTRKPWVLVSDEVTRPETAPHAVEIAVSAVTPDPDSLLFNMFSSTVPPTWMSASHLKDAEVDALLDRGRAEMDPDKRAAIYAELNQKLTDLAPAIFSYEFTGLYTIRDGIEMTNLETPGKGYGISSFSVLFKDVAINE